jgi:hypothetical protein
MVRLQNIPVMPRLLTLLFLVAVSFSATANGSDPRHSTTKVFFGLVESLRFQTLVTGSDPENDLPLYLRKHKVLPEDFSGYAIELIESDGLLPLDYPLFLQFGSVHYTALDYGRYSYCLIVDFSSKQSLQNFIANVVEPRADYARMVKIKKGKRVRSYRSKRRT